MAKRLTGRELQDYTDRMLVALICDPGELTTDDVQRCLVRLAEERGLVEYR
jgi:hypothetical protein